MTKPATPARTVQIVEAASPDAIGAARTLFRAYAESLNFDLCFQGFEEELAGLPGRYAPPSGTILLAQDPASRDWLGCVAMRDLGGRVCEMKRMYVVPAARGLHLGRRLGEAIVAAARNARYRLMRLDTVASMTAAIALYTSLGFRETAAYYANPLPDVRYFELTL